MADLSTASVLGIKVETVAGTYEAPTTSDLITVADLRPNIAGLTSDVREFTGSIHRPGAKVGGSTFEATGRFLLRGPGGASVPAAGAFVPGRLLRAAGFAETIISAAIGPEAVSGGTTTAATLGAGATGTADLYTCLAIMLDALGAQQNGLTMIKDYTAGKVASFAETHSGAITGDYTIPEQLAYVLTSATPPTLSASLWMGNKRYNGVGCAVSNLRIAAPTFTRNQTEYPSIEFTITGDLEGDADEAAPTPDTTIAVPPFKDGKLWIANTKLGGSSFGIDLGAEVDYAPNPNKVTGNDSAQLVGTTRSANVNLNQVAKTVFDFLAMADAQAYHSLMALWGLASGNRVGLIVPEARCNYGSPDNSGNFVTIGQDWFIDIADKSVGIVFPFD